MAAWEPPAAGAVEREAPPGEADEDLASWEGPFSSPLEKAPPPAAVAPSARHARQGERRSPEAAGPSRLALPGKPTPPLELPLPILVLTEQARRAPEKERPELALRLNALLEQIAAEGGNRPLADTFHRLLETGKLEGLVDTRGRSCRAVAVESLLSLGFPYALEVRPEDLEHLRAHGRRGVGHALGPAVPGTVLVAGLLTQVAQELARSGGPDSLVTTQVGLSVLALMALWLAPPKSAVYRVGLGLLALVTCLGLVVPLVTDGPVGLWVVLGGLVAAFLAALRES
ncbi:hypothetical protein [Pyxidicoccus sp. MSG2]|uniref:hypothetical protein n=1 Tax=Pyxidicoccus sp. MSG2 TaxID=2996790 RepID=UPI0022721642|nr:hypothetical protein [Pyxidicoccus sp. MSG2]MCY1016424.1 hypothetical protein [Pyxidicoccus sp. MSG2]